VAGCVARAQPQPRAGPAGAGRADAGRPHAVAAAGGGAAAAGAGQDHCGAARGGAAPGPHLRAVRGGAPAPRRGVAADRRAAGLPRAARAAELGAPPPAPPPPPRPAPLPPPLPARVPPPRPAPALPVPDPRRRGPPRRRQLPRRRGADAPPPPRYVGHPLPAPPRRLPRLARARPPRRLRGLRRRGAPAPLPPHPQPGRAQHPHYPPRRRSGDRGLHPGGGEHPAGQVRLRAAVSAGVQADQGVSEKGERVAAAALHWPVSGRQSEGWREQEGVEVGEEEDGEEGGRDCARVPEPDSGEDGGGGEVQSVQEVVWDRGQCPGRVLGSSRDILPLGERKTAHGVFEGDV